MENKLIINYTYMIESKEEEWIDIINQARVNVSWFKTNFRIEIKWNWGEESKVKELVEKIMTIFGDAEIAIENSKYKRISLHKETKTPISIFHEEPKNVSSKEYNNVSSKEPNNISLKEYNNVSSKEDNVTLPLSQHPLPQKEKKEILKPDYEKAFKDFFEGKLSEYNFTEEDDVNKFCNDFKIKNEVLRIAILFSNTSTNEMLLSKELGKYFSKNAALAKIELRKSFEKWINEFNPSFILNNQGVNVFHFLNYLKTRDKKT